MSSQESSSTWRLHEPAQVKRTRLVNKPLLIAVREDARTYSNTEKWLFTAIASLGAAVAPLGSAMLMPALPQITAYFHVPSVVANLSVAFYALAMAIIPLWWSALSERYGRRPIYIVSFFVFLIWNSVAAVSVSIEMFIVMRFLAGGASASVQAVGASTVADLWEVERRSNAMGYFFLGPMLGPLVSPIVGGILTDRFGWRSTQWGAVVYGGFVWLMMIFLLAETSSNRHVRDTSDEKGPGSRASRLTSGLWQVCLEPLRSITYLRLPPLLMTTYYAGITFASYYSLNIAIQTLFSRHPYSFRATILGLMYAPGAFGSILAAVLGGRWTDYIMKRQAKLAGRYNSSGQLEFRPADRMCENAWMAAALYPAALLAFGWATEQGVFWFVPVLICFLFGVGNSLIFNVTTTILTEIVPGKASHAIALGNLVRNTMSCTMAIVTEPLIDAVGINWVFTGLAIICWASSIVIWIIRRNSERWTT